MYYVWDRVKKEVVPASLEVKKSDVIENRDRLNRRAGKKRYSFKVRKKIK